MSDAIFAREHHKVFIATMDRCSNIVGQALCTALRINSGTILASSLNSVVVNSGSAVSSTYTGMGLHIYSGVGSGQTARVTSYDGAARRAFVAFDTLPVSGSLYQIINRVSACYNTFPTCLDKPNYVRSTHDYSFSTVGARPPVGQTIRPYIKTLSDAATEVRLEGGLADRGSVTINLFDETDNDTEMDPYVEHRASAAQGSFWTRWIKRNPNYAGRPATVRRAYFSTASWDTSEMTNEMYVLDSFKGPDNDGIVTITLKDVIKLADRVKIPFTTNGKLLNDFLPSDSSFEVNPGEGDEYPDFNGLVRIGDQIIQYSGKEVELGWNFTNTANGWSAEQGSLSINSETIGLWASSLNLYLINNSMSIDGMTYRYIGARVKRTAFVGSFQGKLTYFTTTHSFDSSSYYATVSQPAAIDSDYVTLKWDMHALTQGGSDWQDSTIRGLRVELGANSGGAYLVDWIAYSPVSSIYADTFHWPDSTYRSKFFTTAASAKVGDGVQLCLVFSNAYVTSVMQYLLNQGAAVPTSYIDTAGFASENTNWLGNNFLVNACLSEPETVSNLLKELCIQTNGVMWVSPTEQKVKYKVVAPPAPADVASGGLSDDANLIDDTVVTARLEDLRRTSMSVRYNLATAVSNLKEDKSYLSSATKVDSNAASANEYGDDRDEIIYSRWFTNSNALGMRILVSRRLALFRDAPDEPSFMLDPKDDVVTEATFRDITTSRLVNFDGSPATNRAFVTKRQLQENGRIKITARITPFSKRYAYIAPASLGNYSAVSSYQRNYAFVCNTLGFMSDGSSGYLII